jgi:hypothetical protein
MPTAMKDRFNYDEGDTGATRQMEKQHGIDQPTSTLPRRWATFLLGTVVTANILIHILLRWKSYDWLGKSLCVVLMSNLALMLVQVFLEIKGKRKLQPDTLMLFSYISLMLTTSVFNYH